MVGCAGRHPAPTSVQYDLALTLIIRKTSTDRVRSNHFTARKFRAASCLENQRWRTQELERDNGPYGLGPDTVRDAVKAKRPVTARDLFIRTETPLSSTPVTHNLRKRYVHGFADHTLWFGSQQRMETNLVVWEAKREGSSQLGEPQL